MSIVLRVAEPHLSSPLELFWVDEGKPGHFVQIGAEQTEIVFHTRYLVLSQCIQTLLRRNVPYDAEDVCERTLLRFAAEFFLYEGTRFTDQSIQTLARSRLGCSIYLPETTINPGLELLPFGARYMTAWFSGMCHELGHARNHAVKTALGGLDPLSESVVAMTRHAVAEHYYPKDFVQLLSAINAFAHSRASVSSIAEEASADLFSLCTLLESHALITEMGARNVESSDFDSFLLLFLIELMALELVEQTKMWVRWFSASKINIYGPAELRVGMCGRLNAILQVLTDPDSMEPLRVLFPSLRSVSPTRSVTRAIVEEVQRRLDALAAGIERARAFMSSKEMRDTTLLYRYLEFLETDPIAQREARTFVGIARSRGHDSPELSAIEERAMLEHR
jgi:hypothetical protein